jgi:hypothetical protein
MSGIYNERMGGTVVYSGHDGTVMDKSGRYYAIRPDGTQQPFILAGFARRWLREGSPEQLPATRPMGQS